MRHALWLCFVMATGAPAAAEDVFQRPLSCERVATAQNNDCEVINIFTCQQEGGLTSRYEIIDDSSEMIVILWDGPTNALSVHMPWTGDGLSITIKGPRVSDVLATGSADLSASGEVKMMGMTREVTGIARYTTTDRTVEMAEQTFRLVDVQIEAYPPYPMEPMLGSLVVAHSEALELSVVQEGRFDLSDESEVSRLSFLALPGQEGFGVETATVGCTVISQRNLSLPKVPV